MVRNFWLLLRSDYPALTNKALQHLIPFCTTDSCEQAFSILLYMKPEYRNKLNVETELRIKLSNIEPDIAVLVSRKQLHPSH
ncbi:Protein FAM200A [Anthophora plagiata]